MFDKLYLFIYIYIYIYINDILLAFDILPFSKTFFLLGSRKKVFEKDSFSKGTKMSFLFILIH